ncbi:hypothetical protein BVRB_1g020800 [Beta vulgaris subsp. vulgaris]|uniref:BTB domain-containing protein n=1 Tax=Beta vulgaris subsp. vulgaris TaxID=3555 RepID=A0A0J8BI69_BETVV|nr:hypothetical protein BVRB_1g020800 [Beta vulgaris subsp. vulgaris]
MASIDILEKRINNDDKWGLANFLESWELSDVVFIVGVEEKPVPAHKVILAAAGVFHFGPDEVLIQLREVGYPILHNDVVNGDVYAGEYFADKMHGFGVYKFANGHQYEGSWHEGRRQGLGVYSFRQWEAQSGYWQNGQLVKATCQTQLSESHFAVYSSKVSTAIQVISMSLNSMRIPFQPLLRQINECLSFQVPVYGVLDLSKNNACVAVRTECGPVAYVYVGGEAASLDESCDKAAEKAAHDLINKYSVHVEDFTAGKKRGLDRHITLDYMSVLPMVVKHTQALLTPLESIFFDGSRHTAWLTVTCPHNAHGITCIFGDACATLADSKQSDANYKAANYAAVLCALERESYLTTKERVLNIQEPIHPSPLVVEQDCLTPRGKQFQIPTMVSPPFPPKKRKARSSFGNVSSSTKNSAVPLLSIPSEFEIVLKRAKKDGC